MSQGFSRKRPLREADILDPQSGDVVDVAVQTTHALMDMSQIQDAQMAFEDGEPTLTKNPQEPGQRSSPYRGVAGKLGWRDIKSRHEDLRVSCALNGYDADAVAAYPYDAEMARLATERKLQVIGSFMNGSEPLSKDDPDAALVVAGLQSLDAINAVPGAIAVAHVPPLGVYGVGQNDDGTGCKVQMLVTRPANPMLVGETFARTMAHILKSPETWKRSMDGYYNATNVWINASTAQLDSHLFTSLVLIQQLVAAGKLAVPANDAQGRANDELLAGNGGQLNSLELMQRLAQFYGLLKGGNAMATIRDPAKIDEYKLAQHRFASQAFYLPDPETGRINLADELGARYDPQAQQILTPARTSETRQLKDDELGRLVRIQHNHFKLAAAGFAEAANEELRKQVGTYVSTSRADGSGRAQVSMHVAS